MLSCRPQACNRAMSAFRHIPSIDEFLLRARMRRAIDTHGRASVVDAARLAADELRAMIGRADAPAESIAAACDWMEARVEAALARQLTRSLRRVVNATGVILHTNLGRAPLAASALAHAA